MHTWQLHEAKSRFSEVVALSLSEGPQMVTRRGEDAVVVLAAREYRRLCGAAALKELLQHAPRGETLAIERSAEAVRDFTL